MEKMAESFVAASELQLEHTLEDFDIATQQLLAQGSQCLQRRKLVSFQTDEMCKFCFVLKTIVCACVCVCDSWQRLDELCVKSHGYTD